jgi:RES domain
MYHRILPDTKLYRVTSLRTDWPTPLHGLGAYFTKGGRYNRIYQPTVYCSDDPLVAIAEAAFYQSREWHEKISVYRVNPVPYPLITSHRLWCFAFKTLLSLIDLMSDNAFFRFQFSPHMLLNPSQIYAATQQLADDIRGLIPPPGSTDPRPEGLRAPSVRTPISGNVQPCQFALFVSDPALLVPFEHRATLLEKWNLSFEFLEADSHLPVSFNSKSIDWQRPQYRLDPNQA